MKPLRPRRRTPLAVQSPTAALGGIVLLVLLLVMAGALAPPPPRVADAARSAATGERLSGVRTVRVEIDALGHAACDCGLRNGGSLQSQLRALGYESPRPRVEVRALAAAPYDSVAATLRSVTRWVWVSTAVH